MANVSQSIEAYLDAGAQIRKAVRGMSRDQLTARPIPGTWSTLEVVCHLADSDQAWAHRMKRVVAEEKPLLIGYDESKFTAALGYHQANLEEEIAFIDQTRRQLARVLKSLPPEAWRRTGIHNERGLITLEEMLAVEIDHVTHHLRFIVAKRKALGLPE